MSENPLSQYGRKPKRVGMILDWTYGFGRGIVEGVTGYAMSAGWRLYPHVVSMIHPPVDPPDVWDVDGVIAGVCSDTIQTKLSGYPAPVVCTPGQLRPSAFTRASLAGHDEEVGRLAASYFRDGGFSHLAIGNRFSSRWGADRVIGFKRFVEEHGVRLSEFDQAIVTPGTPSNEIEDGLRVLRSWLAGLTAPAGVFCVDDNIAEIVINAAHEIGRHVPEELSVLGVGNDPLVTAMTLTPLSSIELNSSAIGYAAAHLLDRLMAGQPVEQIDTTKPQGVIVRASSDLSAIADRDVA